MLKTLNYTKMKTMLRYKLCLIFLLVSNHITANNARRFEGKHTKEKTIKKEFSVHPNATLEVDNSYGNINITTYEGAMISIEIRIKTNGNDLEKVNQKLNDISIDFSDSNTLVSAKTSFNKTRSSSWWNWGKRNTVNMEINYIIKMPITNNINITNDYGNIDLDKLEGRAVIHCDYGKITTKELMSSANDISFDYTNNSYFEFINGGNIDANYSGYTVGKAKELSINADYTKSEVEIAERITYNCDYGSIKINNANTVLGNGDYLTVRLGTIYKHVNLKADYGSIKIEKMAANAEHIEIESDFNGITIGYDTDFSFKFDIDLEYASLRNTDDFEFSKKHIESTDQYYQGYYRDKNTPNYIRIKSEYGSVSFKKK